MALLDMIKQSMVETPDPSAMEMYERDTRMDDQMAMEALGGYGEFPEEPAPVVEQIRVMDAGDVLSALESHMGLRGEEDIAAPQFKADAIKAALEEGLPAGAPPYDPTAELEDLAATLAGLDDDDNIDPDQPSPEENIENNMTVNNLATEPQDTEDPSEAGVISVEAFIDNLRGDQPANEGVTANFKNRKLNNVNSFNWPKFSSVKKMLEAMEAAPADQKKYGCSAYLNSIPLNVDRHDGAPAFTDDDVPKINRIIGLAGRVAKLLAESIVKCYNEGEGPWAWNDDYENKVKHTASQALAAIKLETIAIDRFSDGHTQVTWFFQDGNLYGGHVLVIDYGVVDYDTGKIVKNEIEYSVEG